MRFRLELTVNTHNDGIDCIGKLAGTLEAVAQRIRTRYGNSAPIGTHIDRTVSTESGTLYGGGAILGRYCVEDGIAWGPHPLEDK